MIQKIKRKYPVKKATKSELTKKDKVDTKKEKNKKEVSLDLDKVSAEFIQAQVPSISKNIDKTTEVDTPKKIDDTETIENNNTSTSDEDEMLQNSFFNIEEVTQSNLFNQEDKLEQALAILQG